jgi:hypothetical protein
LIGRLCGPQALCIVFSSSSSSSSGFDSPIFL